MRFVDVLKETIPLFLAAAVGFLLLVIFIGLVGSPTINDIGNNRAPQAQEGGE